MSMSRRLIGSLRQFGIDPITGVAATKNFPKYVSQLIKFKIASPRTRVKISVALNDFQDSAGSAQGHYFWQDLICARWIYESGVKNHLDCGSRIDGFIAHLLTFASVKTIDIRPMSVNIPGLMSVIGNAQESLTQFENGHTSVSSLHSIEHFGLGRYGDPIDAYGHEKGLRNISSCVSVGGLLYVSFPIGESSVEFNAQRVIDPEWAENQLPNFVLEDFVLIPWKDEPIYGLKPSNVDRKVWGQAGLYKFKRVA